MKTLITLLLTAITITGTAQYGHKECINEKYIDLKTTYIYFEIKGLIEIDGHTFLNDTCEVPLIFTADKEGIFIGRRHEKNGLIVFLEEYAYHDCGKKGCEVLHLKDKYEITIFRDTPWEWENTFPFYQNVTTPGFYFINDSLILDYD